MRTGDSSREHRDASLVDLTLLRFVLTLLSLPSQMDSSWIMKTLFITMEIPMSSSVVRDHHLTVQSRENSPV